MLIILLKPLDSLTKASVKMNENNLIALKTTVYTNFLARTRGEEKNSPAHQKLQGWLHQLVDSKNLIRMKKIQKNWGCSSRLNIFIARIQSPLLFVTRELARARFKIPARINAVRRLSDYFTSLSCYGLLIFFLSR